MKRPKCVALWGKGLSGKRYGRTLQAGSRDTTWPSSITLFVGEITAGYLDTTIATANTIGILPVSSRTSALSVTSGCWGNSLEKCGTCGRRRSRYEIEDQYRRF